VIGFLKVGAKHLYVHDSHGQVHERTPLCVLDFYVHENKQRSGYGKQLFDVMLEVD
jgi:alpha-tubulin N-acetyltransferase 1